MDPGCLRPQPLGLPVIVLAILVLQVAETQILWHATVPLQAQKMNKLFILKALAAIRMQC